MRIIVLLLFLSSKILAQQIATIKIAKPKKEKCSATLLGKSGGNITIYELMACNSIEVNGACDYKVVSFLFSCSVKTRLYEYSSKEEYFSPVIRTFILNLRPGERFFIEKIRVKSNVTGQEFLMPSLKFKVIP
jgi:hypothetical protein